MTTPKPYYCVPILPPFFCGALTWKRNLGEFILDLHTNALNSNAVDHRPPPIVYESVFFSRYPYTFLTINLFGLLANAKVVTNLLVLARKEHALDVVAPD